MWRPGFPFVRCEPATLPGFVRRFWQGSTDHRGVPRAPGRVVTLVREPSASCEGFAFQVAPDLAASVIQHLDERERGGYTRVRVEVRLNESRTSVDGVTYIAGPDNPNYLGPAPLSAIAAQIRQSTGPSGHNSDYVLELARLLRSKGIDEPHVFEIADLLS